MTVRNLKQIILATCALGLVFSVAPLIGDTQAAIICKDKKIRATGEQSNMHLEATSDAQRNWVDLVRRVYDESWADWSIAKNKTISCKTGSEYKYACKANGKPCKNVIYLQPGKQPIYGIQLPKNKKKQ